jgi:hypothetical protein
MTTETPDRGHPEELLASYADGSIGPADRSAVDEHLARCERCRREIELAGRGLAALRSLPEATVPAHARRGLIRELDRETIGGRGRADTSGGDATGLERRAGRRSKIPVVLGGLAAAAVLVGLGLFVVAPLMTGNGGEGSAGISRAAPESTPSGKGARAPVTFTGPPAVEVQSVDYDAAKVAGLASAAAADVRAGTLASAAQADAKAGQAPGAGDAIACADRWAGDAKRATVVRVIEASYEGRPAYISLGLQPPRSGPDRVLIWVLGRSDCTVISFSQQQA